LKRKRYLLFIILTIVSGLAGGAISNYLFMGKTAVAQSLFNSTGKEGSEPYIPTKIEWLALTFQAAYSTKFTDGYNFSLYFIAAPEDPNTIIIFVSYSPKVDRVLLNKGIENAKKLLLRMKAIRPEWEWLKIKEEVEMTEQ